MRHRSPQGGRPSVRARYRSPLRWGRDNLPRGHTGLRRQRSARRCKNGRPKRRRLSKPLAQVMGINLWQARSGGARASLEARCPRLCTRPTPLTVPCDHDASSNRRQLTTLSTWYNHDLTQPQAQGRERHYTTTPVSKIKRARATCRRPSQTRPLLYSQAGTNEPGCRRCRRKNVLKSRWHPLRMSRQVFRYEVPERPYANMHVGKKLPSQTCARPCQAWALPQTRPSESLDSTALDDLHQRLVRPESERERRDEQHETMETLPPER